MSEPEPQPKKRRLGGKYVLVEPLGQGGMGSVWVAEHLTLHSLVAVKLLGFAIAWLDSRLDLTQVAAGLANPTLELAIEHLVEAKNDIARHKIEPGELVDALNSAAQLLHETQKACTGRVGALPN